MTTDQPIKILIVDDNAQYREAFKRTLLLENYEVCEAADADEAIAVIESQSPDVVVTDLQMRTDREGLELIETIKASDPFLPVIMISAVGSFEEGALATRMGAVHVIHKSRIEDEMESFFETIRQSHESCRKSRSQLAMIARARQHRDLKEDDDRVEAVRALLDDPDADPHVQGEAYDFITSISEVEMLRRSELDMQNASESDRDQETYAAALAKLNDNLAGYDGLGDDSRQALATAEYLYELQENRELLDFSRTVAFSYCFAVECEVRIRLKGKITRLASNRINQRIFEACMDKKTRRVDMGFQQNLMLAARNRGVHFTIDNVKAVLMSLMGGEGRFRANGLKDIGILLLCFAREYSFSKWGQTIRVKNPLNVKGLQYEDEVLALAGSLIDLQYARNPYIHPDVKKREQLAKLRQTALDCLNELSRVV